MFKKNKLYFSNNNKYFKLSQKTCSNDWTGFFLRKRNLYEAISNPFNKFLFKVSFYKSFSVSSHQNLVLYIASVKTASHKERNPRAPNLYSKPFLLWSLKLLVNSELNIIHKEYFVYCLIKAFFGCVKIFKVSLSNGSIWVNTGKRPMISESTPWYL
jgi:hypothetical protein